MKVKGQQPIVANQELLASADYADVGKWSNPSPLHGGAPELRGFESHRRLKLEAPVEVAPSTRAVNRTAKAVQLRTPIIRLLAVELNRRFHSDLPQLPDRMPEVR